MARLSGVLIVLVLPLLSFLSLAPPAQGAPDEDGPHVVYAAHSPRERIPRMEISVTSIEPKEGPRMTGLRLLAFSRRDNVAFEMAFYPRMDDDWSYYYQHIRVTGHEESSLWHAALLRTTGTPGRSGKGFLAAGVAVTGATWSYEAEYGYLPDEMPFERVDKGSVRLSPALRVLAGYQFGRVQLSVGGLLSAKKVQVPGIEPTDMSGIDVSLGVTF